MRNLIDKIRLLTLRKDKESYLVFYNILGFLPKDISYYHAAVLHKSCSQHIKNSEVNNERLEFLGDAILGSVVGHILFTRYKKCDEGFLTNTRSRIVRRDTLNTLAVKIGLDKLIVSSKHFNTHNSNINGNAFEALIGAIYLDQGYNRCRWFVSQLIDNKFIDVEGMSHTEMNFKSKLIEWGQKHKVTITFELTNQEEDSHHDMLFKSTAMIGKLQAGNGKGYSKKESQQNAAKEALNRLRKDNAFKKVVGELIEQIKKSENEAQQAENALKSQAESVIEQQGETNNQQQTAR